MTITRLIIVLAASWFALQWWQDRETATSRAFDASPNGFVSVVMPDGATDNTVIIFAPKNCPSDAAQRADDLSAELTRLGISNLRSASFSAQMTDPGREQKEGVQRAVAVMNDTIPAVFINGMAKANPTVEEVVAEFGRTQ